MEIISGYFVSRQQALEAAEYLRQKDFKGQISVMGHNNEEEDIGKTENLMNNTDYLSNMSNYGAVGFGGVPIGPGFTPFMMQGSGSLVVGGALFGIVDGTIGGEVNGVLSKWGVPKKEGEEIKRVIDSGNSVILIKCEDNERQFVSNALEYKGAQNIHS
jgi:hypothetical protein